MTYDEAIDFVHEMVEKHKDGNKFNRADTRIYLDNHDELLYEIEHEPNPKVDIDWIIERMNEDY